MPELTRIFLGSSPNTLSLKKPSESLPMISPSLFFLTLMNLIACFKMFETVNIMTAGGPANATSTLVYSLYQYGFKFYKLGYASAEGVVLMVIIGACTLVYFGALSKRVHYR